MRPLLFCLALFAMSTSAAAQELKTQAGDLTLPEGFTELDRNEDPGKDGSPSSLYVFGRSADALPRAIYILTFAKPQLTPGEELTGTAEAAAIMANPMAAKPDLRKSKPVRVGDATRGRALFQGKAECAQCHRVNGVGPRLAPDLSDIGAIRTLAALQRALLTPDESVLPIHRGVTVVTKDGRTLRGRRLNEDTYTVQFIDEQENLLSLEKASLRELAVDAEVRMPSYAAFGKQMPIVDDDGGDLPAAFTASAPNVVQL